MATVRQLAGVVAGGLALAAVPVVAQAQVGTVSGRVVDSTSGQGIIGVSVRIDGTPLGTQTAPDGRYSITGVPVGARALRVARIGFRAQTVPVTVTAGGTATANVTLAALAAQLTEVVAVAYSSGGNQDRRNVTGAVAAVDSSLFNKGRVVSAEDLIQAKVAGVQVVSSNEPGGGIAVRVRGGSSVTGVNDPLFVIDGIPLPVGGGYSGGRNPLNFLNPQDIANVTVLKDAQATAIYGSRGSNGVVLITTKNGSQGGAQITYGANYSNRRVAKAPEYLDAAQFRAVVQQYATNNVANLGTANTNWFDALKQTGGGQEHNLAVGGTRQDLQYRVSLGYLGDEGVLRGDRTNRLSGQLNYSDRLFKDVVDLQATLRGVRTKDVFGATRFLGNILGSAPTDPIYNSDGTFFATTNVNGPRNPLAQLAGRVDNGQTDRGLGNLQVRTQLPFLKGLSATVRGSFDAARVQQNTFIPTTDPGEAFNADTLRGSFYQNVPNATTLVLDAYGSYTTRVDRLGGADVDLTGGYSYETFRGNNASFTALGLSTNALGSGGIQGATRTLTPAVSVQETRLASFFGRANVTLAERYLFGLSVRRDGSSRFGPNNQWGTFPAGSLGWRLSEEPFLKGKLPGVSDLKLRYSFGINGNQPGNDQIGVVFPTFSYSTTQSLIQFGNAFVPTVQPSAANPSLKWEQSTTHNVGLDYGVLRGRLTGTVDYYRKTTDNLLFTAPVPGGSNFNNFLLQNVGSLRNAGVEFGLSAGVLTGQGGGRLGRLRYDANLNATTNRNRVLRTNGTTINTGFVGGNAFNSVEVIKPGLPVNTYYVFQHRSDAGGNPVVGPNTAQFDTTYYVDQNGDKAITDADRVPFHNPQPRWILGHTSQFGYGRVDLGFTLRAYLGYYVYNGVAANSGTYSTVTTAGVLYNIPTSVYRYNFVNRQYLSDLYVEKADFLRMDNLTLGYTLPALGAFRATRVFGTVQNLFTTTKYSGVDPLAAQINTTSANTSVGIDNNTYPLSRIFTVGFNVGF